MAMLTPYEPDVVWVLSRVHNDGTIQVKADSNFLKIMNKVTPEDGRTCSP